jgi:DNA-binding NarL/FixJ family response regulator
MSVLLRIFLIDQDPIFRLGLEVSLVKIPNLQVVGNSETIMAALPMLEELESQSVDLVILEFANGEENLESLQYLKAEYPNLPIFILSSLQDVSFLQTIKAMGVNGYCHKGTAISELVMAIENIAGGGEFWQEVNEDTSKPQLGLSQKINQKFFHLRLSGNNQINTNLQQVRSHLRSPGVNIWEKAILAGKQRELLAARWVINHLLPSFPAETGLQVIPTAKPWQLQPVNSPALKSLRGIQSVLFAECVTKLQSSLENISETPLEVDILRVDKKTELLNLVLQKFAQVVDELRISQLDVTQLSEMRERILLDLWQITTIDFFGKFSRIDIGNNSVEIVTILLQDAEIVKSQILRQIPLFNELLIYLIFPDDIYIENTSYSSHSIEAKSYVLNILENLLIQIANAVLQPLLNRLADLESIKQNFYHQQLMSTREIERFRNDLSWKYRWQNYVTEAQAIFESRYELFVIVPRGIAKISVYTSRQQELRQLTGIPLTVTLLLEFRDAIAPRLKSLVSLFGNTIVFILTQIIGRGIGLIGRGILQGMGNVSFPDKKSKHDSKF